MLSINGPMCNDFEGLEMYAKAVVDSEPWHEDAKCLPIPWTPVAEQQLGKKLTLLVLTDNGIVTPTPTSAARLEARHRQLTAAGHKVVRLNASSSASDSELFLRGQGHIESFFRAEGGATQRTRSWPRRGSTRSGSRDSPKPTRTTTPPSKNSGNSKHVVTAWQSELLARIQTLAGGKTWDAIIAPVAAEVSTTHDAYHHIFLYRRVEPDGYARCGGAVARGKGEKQFDKVDGGFKVKERE